MTTPPVIPEEHMAWAAMFGVDVLDPNNGSGYVSLEKLRNGAVYNRMVRFSCSAGDPVVSHRNQRGSVLMFIRKCWRAIHAFFAGLPINGTCGLMTPPKLPVIDLDGRKGPTDDGKLLQLPDDFKPSGDPDEILRHAVRKKQTEIFCARKSNAPARPA